MHALYALETLVVSCLSMRLSTNDLSILYIMILACHCASHLHLLTHPGCSRFQELTAAAAQ